MGRSDRKRMEREQQKMKKVADKLTPNQLKLFNIGVKEKVREAIIRYNFAVDAALIEYGTEYERLEEVTERANEIMAEEMNNELEEFEMTEKLTRSMIVESAKKHGLDGQGRRKIAKELGSTYSTISTYVSRWKIKEEDLKPKVVIPNDSGKKKDDEEVEKAAEKIIEIIEDDSDKKQEVSKVEEEKAENIIEAAKEMQCNKLAEEEEKESLERDRQALVKTSSLKVKSMVLEGENGTYRVCDKGVELNRNGLAIFFENVQQVEEWAQEFKEVFGMMGVSKCI